MRLRLFHREDLASQIAERTLEAGELTIGRDPGADWSIDDPSLSLSRRHCRLAVRGGRLSVTDSSANGTFLGPARRRLTPGAATPVAEGETVRLGEYILVAAGAATHAQSPGEAVAADQCAPETARPIAEADETSGAVGRASEGALLEAFCEGAGVDPSALSGVDALGTMRRAGLIYRQMIEGLEELMRQRTQSRESFLLDGTRVHASGNNPFRWAPAQRVAVDLLRASEDGFLRGPEAVKASFDDLSDHLTRTFAGMQGAVASILGELDPDTLENRTREGLAPWKSRMSAAWAEYLAVYRRVSGGSEAQSMAVLGPRFREAYEGAKKRPRADRA